MRSHQISQGPSADRVRRPAWHNDRSVARTPPPGDSQEPDPERETATDAFLLVRGRLFGIAYRMLGSVADAEDIVQEVWLRWHGCDRSVVRDPSAFLAATTTRLALNLLQSARVRHEAYVGPWLPEPIDTAVNADLVAEHAETIELVVLFLLERLTPLERAVYVLREAFLYPYDEIAEILSCSEANARQLVSRARKHVAGERRTPVARSEQHRFLTAFLDAARSGDLAALQTLLIEDVVSYSDGGTVFHAARFPLLGRTRVVKFVLAVSEWFWDGVDVQWIEANGQPALRLSVSGKQIALLAVTVTEDGIDRLFWMMNSTKLDGVLPA
jgi:RNA polymerase sigma-70 factor (ECF subfamily)